MNYSFINMANFIPILGPNNMLERKKFAMKHLDLCNGEFWTHACFGDEQRYAFDSSGQITFHSGSHGLHVPNTVAVWGCASADGLQALEKLHGRLDTAQYINLLRCNLLPHLAGSKLYIHDFFPVHTSKSVRDFIAANNINVMNEWPKKSGDLMPLENVWREILKRLLKAKRLVFNCEDLWNAIREMWLILVEEGFIVNIIQSLPQRLNSIVETDGEWVIV